MNNRLPQKTIQNHPFERFMRQNVSFHGMTKDEELENIELNLESVEHALKLFDWFDENTGHKYYFLAKYSENKVDILNDKLKNYDLKLL